jgi:hypothetical protein
MKHASFTFDIRTGSRTYKLTCELVSRTKAKEVFKIFPTANPDKFILIEGNRPLLRSKGLKTKGIKWNVIQGEVSYPQNLAAAIKQIELNIE